MEIENRQQFIDDLGDYLTSARQSIDSFISKLGWTNEGVRKDLSSTIKCCPFNPSHLMPAASIEKHKIICEWKSEGYSKQEIEQALPSSHFFYQHSTSIVPVLIDKTVQSKILSDAAMKDSNDQQSYASVERNVPRTMDRVVTEFTPRERLAIYEFVIDRMKQIKKESLEKYEDLQYSLETKKDSNDGKPKSKLELIAEYRDYKRRRQSYRAKNVHITKKSYTEVMREVIQNQMEMLTENFDDELEKNDEDHPIKSENSDNRNRSYGQSKNNKSESNKYSVDYEESSSSKRSYDYNERSSKYRSAEYSEKRSSNKHYLEYEEERPSKKRSYEHEEERPSKKRSYEHEEERPSKKRSYEHEEERPSKKRSYEHEKERSKRKHSLEYDEERSRDSSRHRKHKSDKRDSEHHRHHHKHKKSKHK